MAYEFTSEVWRWQERRDDWYFVTVPAEFAAEVRQLPLPERGFNAVKVRVTVGGSTWLTSMMPSDDVYVLALKKSVRSAEGIEPGDTVTVAVDVVLGQ